MVLLSTMWKTRWIIRFNSYGSMVAENTSQASSQSIWKRRGFIVNSLVERHHGKIVCWALESHESWDGICHATREEHAKDLLGRGNNQWVHNRRCPWHDLSWEVVCEKFRPFALEGFWQHCMHACTRWKAKKGLFEVIPLGHSLEQKDCKSFNPPTWHSWVSQDVVFNEVAS